MAWVKLATKTYVDDLVTAEDFDFTTTTGAGSVDLDSQALAFTPGAGIDITHSGQAITIAAETAAADNPGVVELATDAETNTGTDAARAVTPAGLTAWTGDTAIVTVGTIGTGTWAGTDVAVAHGGTGASDASTARTNLGLDSDDAVEHGTLQLDGSLAFDAAATIYVKDKASSLALSITAGDVLAGTSNAAGSDLTIEAGAGTGTGAGGKIYFKVADGSSSGTSKNAMATAMQINDNKDVSIFGSLTVSGGTTFVKSSTTQLTDPSLQLNVNPASDVYGSGNAAVVFGDSTGATSSGKIINDDVTGFKFTDAGGQTNTPSGSNDSTAGSAYKDCYMKTVVLATQGSAPAALEGGLYFDGTDLWVGNA